MEPFRALSAPKFLLQLGFRVQEETQKLIAGILSARTYIPLVSQERRNSSL